MQLERTKDFDLVKMVLTHPDIYRHLSDDGSPPREMYRPLVDDSIIYLAVYAGEPSLLMGVFSFVPSNRATTEVHTSLLPHAWGTESRKACAEAIQWVWENTHFLRIITSVPDYNALALKLAKDAGLIEYGRNPKSYLKNGKLFDQILLGVSKCPSQH